jgi:hypothetical protein
MSHEKGSGPHARLSSVEVLLGDAECLCNLLESAPVRALLFGEEGAAIEEAARDLRASIAVVHHDSDKVRARSSPDEPWPSCVTASCDQPASFGFSWPGQARLSACFGCILKVLAVGEALSLDAKALELVYLPAVKP